jgi:hypothetical protein
MQRATALTASDAASLYARCLPSGVGNVGDKVAVGLRAGCAPGTALAALLCSAGENVVAVVGPPRGVNASTEPAQADHEEARRRTMRALERNNVDAVALDMGSGEWTSEDVVRGYAREAIVRGAHRLALPTTMVDAAAAGLVRLDGAVQVYDVEIPGGEMLPPGVLDLVRPLVAVEPATLDASVNKLLGDEWHQPGEGVVPEAIRAVNEIGINVEDALRYGNRRHAAMVELKRASDALMRACIVDVSHWGYAVFCRDSLSLAYNDTESGGRIVAMHMLARLATHVSGNARSLCVDSKVLQPIAHELLHRPLDPRGRLQPLPPAPKGRTIAGAVIRPANGAYVKRWRARSPSRRRPYENFRDDGAVQEADAAWSDLLIISREPDLETSRILSRRMSGNLSSVPIPDHGAGVYWDNRFVISAASAAEMRQDMPVISDQSVILAALSPPHSVGRVSLDSSSFYVRQLRHADWETVTSVSKRVRWHNVPYQCVRGLPAVFQKKVGDASAGVLAAVPHLGLSGRPDMVFTAVRMPRYRSLPTDLDPGFTILPDVEAAA